MDNIDKIRLMLMARTLMPEAIGRQENPGSNGADFSAGLFFAFEHPAESAQGTKLEEVPQLLLELELLLAKKVE